jgi:MFS family permease
VSGCSLGIFNPMASVLMSQQKISELMIGANSTVYFAMLALGTVMAPYFIARYRLKDIIVIGLIMSAASAVLFPMFHNLTPWFVLRIIMGLGVSLYMVAGQTLLNFSVADKNRAIRNGIYSLAFAIGFGVGPVLGSFLYSSNSQYAFIAGSGILLVGAINSTLFLAKNKVHVNTARVKVWAKVSPALMSIFAYGFAEATLVSLFPLFLIEIGTSIQQIGYSFLAFVVGSLLLTLPVMKIADRISISKQLNIILIVGTVMVIGLSLQSVFSNLILMFAFFSGASMGVIYPLAMAYISEKLKANEMISGMSQFTFYFGIGCAAGPIVSAIVIHFSSNKQIFSATIALFTTVIIASILIPLGRKSITIKQG